MFIVLLTFSNNKAQAPRLMEDHNAWIKRGFDDGVFLFTGSIRPSAGGAILAHQTSRADLEQRVNEDPFVAADVVKGEIIEVGAGRTDERLSFLLN